jgi:hypothetical protein
MFCCVAREKRQAHQTGASRTPHLAAQKNNTAAVALSFTPLVGLVGGIALGMAAATKRVATGRILGISGAVKGLVTGDVSAWRVAFLAGLLSAAVVAGAAAPSSFDVLPASFTVRWVGFWGVGVDV